MKNNLKIFLISGKARHGKTTLAHDIKEYYESIGLRCVATSYAKYIKMYATEITKWDGREDTKPRELLQQLGAEVIREKLGKKDFFVKRLHEDMELYSIYLDVVVIDDARTPLEIDYFKELFKENVISIKIIRPNFKNDLSDSERNHITEVGLDNYENYDYTIMNDASLDDLKLATGELLKEIV